MMRATLLRMSRSPWLARQARRRRFIRRAVRRFMPGEELDDALNAAERLARRGIGAILTELGENVGKAEEAEEVGRQYRQALATVAGRRIDAELSVKPTHLGLDLSPDIARANLTAVVREAARRDGTVWLDMEDSSYVDPTLQLVREVRQESPNVGVCLQAYLHRTPDDLDRLREEGTRVRIVKGAYREEPDVAIQRKNDVDQRFHDLAISLLRDRDYIDAATPVFGTHDDRLIERIRESARQYGVAPGQLEFHMLYGIRVDVQEWLTAVGSRVRVLISYGEHWYPWYMRRLAERPANLWFVTRQIFKR